MGLVTTGEVYYAWLTANSPSSVVLDDLSQLFTF